MYILVNKVLEQVYYVAVVSYCTCFALCHHFFCPKDCLFEAVCPAAYPALVITCGDS